VLPAGYVISARWIADRRMILAGYRLTDVLTRMWSTRQTSEQAGYSLSKAGAFLGLLFKLRFYMNLM